MRLTRRSFIPSVLLAAGMLMLLDGCATRVEVRQVGSADPSQGFYEMRGHSLASLQNRAGQLCPKGYAVRRQASQGHAADPAAGPLSKATMSAADWLFPAGSDSAQLLIQCDAAEPRSSQRS